MVPRQERQVGQRPVRVRQCPGGVRGAGDGEPHRDRGHQQEVPLLHEALLLSGDTLDTGISYTVTIEHRTAWIFLKNISCLVIKFYI